jgi:hypothetical protein
LPSSDGYSIAALALLPTGRPLAAAHARGRPRPGAPLDALLRHNLDLIRVPKSSGVALFDSKRTAAPRPTARQRR